MKKQRVTLAIYRARSQVEVRFGCPDESAACPVDAHNIVVSILTPIRHVVAIFFFFLLFFLLN